MNLRTAILCGFGIVLLPHVAKAQAKKPNFLIIFADDIGVSNITAYSRRVMGSRLLT